MTAFSKAGRSRIARLSGVEMEEEGVEEEEEEEEEEEGLFKS